MRHIAPGYQRSNPKASALRQTVRREFERNRNATDPVEIENLKLGAVRALSNYMLATNAPKDPRVKNAVKDYHNRSVQQAKDARSEKTGADYEKKGTR